MLPSFASATLAALCLAYTGVVNAQSSVAAPINIDRTGWTVTAGSQDGSAPASNVLDGQGSTIWQTAAGASLPQNITIDMKGSYFVTGMSYLPRQDGQNSGMIGAHTIQLSQDGQSWTTVSKGTWLSDKIKKTSFFAGDSARYVRIVAESDASSANGQVAAAAEFNVFTPPFANHNRDKWVVKASSEEKGDKSFLADDAVDGAVTSYWQSSFTGTQPTMPITFTIDQGVPKTVSGVRYLPRPEWTGKNGIIGQYRIESSSDGITWKNICNGTWPDNHNLKTAGFAAVSARYFRLVAVTEAGNRGAFAAASDINLLDGSKQLKDFEVTVNGASPDHSADLALDADINSFWETAPGAGFPHTFTINLRTSLAVESLTYVPRQDKAEGRIGAHVIEVSADGATWTKVATGTFGDTPLPKPVNFKQQFAQYVRITVTSEAANRGSTIAAAEITVGFDSSFTPPPGTMGQWGLTFDLPTVAVAAALIPQTGKLLTWASYMADRFDGGLNSGKTIASTYDPAKGTVSEAIITNTRHDMFCPGLSLDFNGRPIITGGNDAARTSIYIAANESFINAPDMKITRGYQSQVTLSDGRTFTIGGSWSGGEGGKDGEVYDPRTNTWKLLSGCPVGPTLTKDRKGVYRSDNHYMLFPWRNETVFHAGPSSAMAWYSTKGSGGFKLAGNRAADTDSMNGIAVMYDATRGRILVAGGSEHYDQDNAKRTTHLIDIDAPNSTVSAVRIADMTYPRALHNSIALPDGQVLVIGGQEFADPFTDDEPVLHPEIWNPDTRRWRVLAPMVTPRTYHSVAVLMPDATVWVGGGGLCAGCSTNHFDGQIFSPPYLFNADGSLAPRPVIRHVSSTSVRNGDDLIIATGAPIKNFALVRFSTATHSVNTDQRRIPLFPKLIGTNVWRVEVPRSQGVALPGFWLLFAIDNNGVPSVAKTIKITPHD